MPQTQLTSYFVDKSNAPKSGFIISDGDNHYPIQDKRVEAAKLALAQDLKPYLWVNVGDQYDFWGLSRFEKEPSRLFGGAATLQKEFDSASAYWDEVCNVTDRVHFILGNHENRLAKLISTNPALYDMQSLAWEVMASLPDNVTVHPYGTRIRLNNIPLGFEHGDQIGSSRGVKHPSAWLLDNKGDRNTIYGHCFDMETEILTEVGWRTRDQLFYGERVVTWNPATRKLEYQPIQSITDYTTYPRMLRITGRRADLLVTDLHGLVDVTNDVSFLPAIKMVELEKCTFVHGGELDRPEVQLTDDELRLCVWIAADGHLEYDPTKSVRVHLKKDRKVERLRGLLDRLHIPFSDHEQTTERSRKLRFSLNGTNLVNLFTWGSKELPKILRYVSPRQGRLIVEEYTHTDGCQLTEKSVQLATSKMQEADLLQEIAVTSGYACNKTLKERDREGKEYASAWILSIRIDTVEHPITVKSGVNPVDDSYTGPVWCVSVSNGTVMVRRNGRVTVTQNTHRMETKNKTTWDEFGKASHYTAIGQGCGVDFSKVWTWAPEPNWQHGFTVIEVYTVGGKPFFSPHPIQVINGRFSFGGKCYDGR